jgi:hypothetical protein
VDLEPAGREVGIAQSVLLSELFGVMFQSYLA